MIINYESWNKWYGRKSQQINNSYKKAPSGKYRTEKHNKNNTTIWMGAIVEGNGRRQNQWTLGQVKIIYWILSTQGNRLKNSRASGICGKIWKDVILLYIHQSVYWCHCSYKRETVWKWKLLIQVVLKIPQICNT